MDLDDAKMHHVQVAGKDIVVVQDEDGLHAFGGVCSHQGCGLWEGKLEGHVVTCQCHGSQFDITDGTIIHGPATASVPSYEVHREGTLACGCANSVARGESGRRTTNDRRGVVVRRLRLIYGSFTYFERHFALQAHVNRTRKPCLARNLLIDKGSPLAGLMEREAKSGKTP